MRRTRDRRTSQEVQLYPGMRTCPGCQNALRERYHKRRFIVRLREQLQVTSHFLQCVTPGCAMREAVYRPEQEDVLALRGYTFGLDVVVLIGQLRYSKNRSIPEIHETLRTMEVTISLKEVLLLSEVYLALVTTAVGTDATIVEQLRAQGGIVLSIDGIQPEKSNETVYVLRDIMSGRVLLARNLQSSATPEIQALIEEVKALKVEIRGVVSDKQRSICLAVERSLPGTPHQICHYHYLREMAQPVCDADRHLKKEIKKQVRGIHTVEKQIQKVLESDSEDPKRKEQEREARVAGDYCMAIRTVMREDGKYPLEPAGLHLVEQLSQIEASLNKAVEIRESKMLRRLLLVLSVLSRHEEAMARISTAYAWIWEITRLLEASGSRQSASDALVRYAEDLKGGEDTKLKGYIEHIQKTTRAFAGKIFSYLDEPLLPKTNNELEQFFGEMKKSRRKATGRKNTQEYILREGQYVAILFGLPDRASYIGSFASVDYVAFRKTLAALRRTADRSKAWKVRRNLPGYLGDVEGIWASPE